MKIRYAHIDKVIDGLTESYPGLRRIPVNLERVVKQIGIELVEKDFEYAMSGAAIIDGDNRIISVNKSEASHRKRFTIAHELGHILLHYDQELNVDVKPIRLNRDFNSATGESWREVEANYFAASLLMPKEQVEDCYLKLIARIDDDDRVLQELASKFEVSMQAMSIRLAKLEMFRF